MIQITGGWSGRKIEWNNDDEQKNTMWKREELCTAKNNNVKAMLKEGNKKGIYKMQN